MEGQGRRIGLYGFFMRAWGHAHRGFMRELDRTRVMQPRRSRAVTEPRTAMADFIVIVLGTTGLLLMGAYAALCERI